MIWGVKEIIGVLIEFLIIRRWEWRRLVDRFWRSERAESRGPTMASLTFSLTSPFTLSSSTSNLRQRSRRRISTTLRPPYATPNSWRHRYIICMAPEEEKMTRRSPLDFPIVSLLLLLLLFASIQALVYAFISCCLASVKV